MAYELLFSEYGYYVYQSEKMQLQQLQQELESLKAQREQLAREVLRLRDDPRALEELIHRELGYVYPDEYMLIVPRGREGSDVRGQGEAK